MRVKIHIGFHKCGSSAVQSGLARSRAALAAQGVVYPEAHNFLDGHHQLAWTLAGSKRAHAEDITAAKLLEEWLAEAAAAKAEVLVLSSEEFEFLQPPAIKILRTLLDGHEVEIYAYIRPQDEYLISEYKQHVRMADTAFAGGIDQFYYRHQLNGRFNYHAVMHRWAAVFGAPSIHITSYHRRSMKDHDILGDFVEAAGLQPFALPAEREINASWGNLAAMAMARINRVGVSPFKREQLAQRLDQVATQMGIDVELLDSRARSALLTSFEHSNQKLLTDFKVRGNAKRLVERKLGPDRRIDQDKAMNDLLTQFIAEMVGKD